VWQFVNRFASFYPFAAVLKSLVRGDFEAWPVCESHIKRRFPNGWESTGNTDPSNFEEACLAMMPREIYEDFVRGYTEKQWGVPARELGAELAGRFTVASDHDPRLKQSAYQGLPQDGYSRFMSNMLNGIPCICNCDYLHHRNEFTAEKRIIYTGAIDELFDYQLGKLAYRAQRRDHRYYPHLDLYQPAPQVNNPSPSNGAYVRTVEWKHVMPPEFAGRIKGTLVTFETPYSPHDSNEYEYPMPDRRNERLAACYKQMAEGLPQLQICGRLAEYRYYDMDQAIERGFSAAQELFAAENFSIVLAEIVTARQQMEALADALSDAREENSRDKQSAHSRAAIEA
jgi:UDP-galactopyranose mutase